LDKGKPRKRQPVSHYMAGGLEVIDILKAKLTKEEFRGFCRANALKYIFRAPHKGFEVDDLYKAETYTRWLREDIIERG